MMIRWDLRRDRMNIISYNMLLSYATGTYIKYLGILVSKYDVRITTFRGIRTRSTARRLWYEVMF